MVVYTSPPSPVRLLQVYRIFTKSRSADADHADGRMEAPASGPPCIQPHVFIQRVQAWVHLSGFHKIMDIELREHGDQKVKDHHLTRARRYHGE
jgi:hypothetical protein